MKLLHRTLILEILKSYWEFDRISSMKYSIIDTLIEQSNTNVIENNIENTDGTFSGSLVLEIESD